eukprot:scaffold1280_cov379-Prasinococcus_capsulatus_cf.AAC.28
MAARPGQAGGACCGAGDAVHAAASVRVPQRIGGARPTRRWIRVVVPVRARRQAGRLVQQGRLRRLGAAERFPLVTACDPRWAKARCR